MQTTDAQVRKLMEEMSKHGEVGRAALRSGMDRKTARKYVAAGRLPSEMRPQPRWWRTRPDAFAADWAGIAERLGAAPELEAWALFEDLLSRHPARYEPGQLRTFQRRVKQWRAQQGPDKEVFFPQAHRPGEAAQTDFTDAGELRITIAGEPFPHLLCHVVLPYSNWQWATTCQSESMLALRCGVQSAVFRLGRIPEFHQTDNSTAATHDLRTGKRGFNQEYVDLMKHLGMKPRTTAVGKKEQNGDVEAANGVLKRRLEQHLLLRGSRDFDSVEAWESWFQDVLEQANRLRQKRLREELAVMRPLSVERLREYKEVDVAVTSWSTIRVKHNTYSVPSRLLREWVRVRVHEDRLEVYHGGRHQLSVERLLGRNGHRINYRHVIGSLVRKPGAFERYRYREELFPTLTFRRTYDVLVESLTGWEADVEYLRVLHLAARTLESEVETALELLLTDKTLPLADHVRALVEPATPRVPELTVPTVDLSTYDGLFETGFLQEVSP
ncbi:MAG: IS21 family transposase [Deltaproteobacteria bacterium]|nr:IS21 family transposase [Deltaproteobacteria bacterium]